MHIYQRSQNRPSAALSLVVPMYTLSNVHFEPCKYACDGLFNGHGMHHLYTSRTAHHPASPIATCSLSERPHLLILFPSRCSSTSEHRLPSSLGRWVRQLPLTLSLWSSWRRDSEGGREDSWFSLRFRSVRQRRKPNEWGDKCCVNYSHK